MDCSPLLRKSSAGPGVAEYEQRVLYYAKKANVLSCVVNLVLCQIGLGGLTLPQMYRDVGWVQGIVMTVVFAWVSAFALYLLDQTCRALSTRTSVGSIANLVAVVFGARGAVALEFLMFVLSFGVMTAYMGPIGVEWHVVVEEALKPKAGSFLAECMSPFSCAVLASVFVMFPIALLPEKLVQDKIGAVATGCTFFNLFVIARAAPWASAKHLSLDACGEAPPSAEEWQQEPVKWVSSLSAIVQATPCFVFSYNGPTGFLPIRAQLWPPRSDPTRGVGRGKVLAVILLAQGALMVNYIITSFLGYMAFCGTTPSNVLDGYPMSAPLPLAARFALAVQLTLVLTGVWLPLNRAAVVTFLYGMGAELPRLPIFALITALSLSAPLGLSALLGGSLALPLGLTSSVCLTIFMFILPGFAAYRSRALGAGAIQRAVPFCFAMFGVLVGVISTSILLRQAFNKV